MCDCCGDLIDLVSRYNRVVNEIVPENEDLDLLSLKPLTRSDLDILWNFIHLWQNRHCSCLFKDPKNVEKLNSLVQGLLLTSANLLKLISRSLSDDKPAFCSTVLASDKGATAPVLPISSLTKGKEPRKPKVVKDEKVIVDESVDSGDFSDEDLDEEEDEDEDEVDEREDDEELEEDVSKWPMEDKEKLFHLVSKVFYTHFPLYAVHKHSIQQMRLDDLSHKEAALISAYCDLNDTEVPILLLRNVTFYCEQDVMNLFLNVFSKATPSSLPLSLAHAIIAVIHHLKFGLNVNSVLEKLVALRTHVINYLCKVPEKDLRVPATRNIFEFIWSVIKEPLDSKNSIVDKEGLTLAFKYFTSSTLTMRLAGITQINNYISLFSEFSQNDSTLQQRQLESHQEELTEWILSNKIIEHIFGPNIHVEVIKQSHIVLNFIVSRITAEHVDAIWSASQLKHCSKQVLDLLTQLVKNMSMTSVLHLYSLLRSMEAKDHSEQTLCLASSILKYIWTRSLNITDTSTPSVSMKVGAPLSDLSSNIVKSPIFTILPARSHDGEQSSTSASIEGSDDDDDVDFDSLDINGQKPPMIIEPYKVTRKGQDDSASSWASNSSSNEDGNNYDGKILKVDYSRKQKVRRKIRSDRHQGGSKKNSEMDSDSDEEEIDNRDAARAGFLAFDANSLSSTSAVTKKKDDGMSRDGTVLSEDVPVVVEIPVTQKMELAKDEGPESSDLAVSPSKDDESVIPSGQSGQDESMLSDDSCHSSKVSQSSIKNMDDFDGEESACENDSVPEFLSRQKSKRIFDRSSFLPSFRIGGNQKTQFPAQPGPSDLRRNQKSIESMSSSAEESTNEQSSFAIENVCKPEQTLLWDLLQDKSIEQLGEGLAMDCEKILCNLICGWLADRRIRMKFIEGCLENLENNRSVIVSLRLLPKLLLSFQQYRSGFDIHTVTLWADKDRNMLSHFFSNLVLYYEKKTVSLTKLYNHSEEIQTRLHFLTFVFSTPGSPDTLKMTQEQVDTLWTSLVNDVECRDELFSWMLNQIRMRDHHALDETMLRYILKEKMPLLKSENFTMTALELLQHLCGFILSHNKHDGQVTSVAIKQLWDIALTTVNTDVSMAAIKHLNNYYIHLQNHNYVSLEKEEEFIEACMTYLKSSSENLMEDEEKYSTIIQRALTLLKTHLEVFRCRYSYHLRLKQLEGDISVISHRTKANERGHQQMIRIVCQPAAISEKMQFEMHCADYMGELRAEISHWWSLIISKLKNEMKNPQNLPVEGPLRLLSQGQELTHDLDEKTLSELGFKDMQLVYLSIGANRPTRRNRDLIEPASMLPAPPKDKLPSVLLLKQTYFEQLFNLTQQLGSMKGSSLIRAQVLSRRVWDIIQILPTSPDLLNCFESITSSPSIEPCEAAEPKAPQQSISLVFNSLLSPNSPQKLIYSVQIVEWLRRSSKKEEKNWSEKFVDCGGLQHIFDIFVSGVLQQNDSDSAWNEWKQDCLASLLQLIYQFGINQVLKEGKVGEQTVVATTEIVTEPFPSKKKQRRKGSVDKLLVHQFNSNLLEMLQDMNSMLRVLLTILQEATSRTSDTNCYQTGFWGRAQVIHHTIIFLTSWVFSDPKVHTALFQSASVNNILKKLVLDDPDPAVRREACSGFYRMCLGFTHSGKKGNVFIPQLLNSLLSFLSVAQNMRAPKASENDEIAFIEKEPYGPGCKDYFWLVCRLVDSLDAEDQGSVNFDRLCSYIADAVVKREIRENRHANAEDEGLKGLLTLMTQSLKHSPPFKFSNDGRKFLNDVFDALFALPNQSERSLPKCKVQSTRSGAFDLIVELVKGCDENHSSLIVLLKEQHNSISHLPYPWDYWPHDDCRSECGYVGLVNLGATCYMASCLQHLFMLPEARNAILAAKISKDTKYEQILFELQRMFAFLLESERKSYNPRSFCKVYTMDHELLNTGEQKDMTEFFTDLITKFEEMTYELKAMVKNLFGGTLSNNVVSLDCPHISRTSEEFYTLRCKVADMRHLWDSLDELTVKDTLEGDNMYTCSQCGRKVRAEKRACIKKLPHILCFNTMRYTFNMITMTKEKVNTHFSFPPRLDMSAYLEENLIPGQSISSEKKRHQESTEYELIGVTVHTGTAEGGHYYSFIRERDSNKDRDKWYMFNDAEVKVFDPNQIGAECFGGEMTSKTYDSVTDKFMDFSFEKTNSAYMLFYERVNKATNDDEPQTSYMKEESVTLPSSCELSPELSSWIWNDNMQFTRDKTVFEHTYFDFMWQVCGYIPQTLPNNQKIVLLSTQLATSFVLETLIHSKEKPTIANWIELLTKQFNASKAACEWLMDYITEDTQCNWPVQILLKCPNQMVRQLFQRLCIHVITQLRPAHATLYMQPQPDHRNLGNDRDLIKTVGQLSCVTRFVKKLLCLTKYNNLVKPHPKHLTEYFAFLYEFAKMGDEEVHFLLTIEAITTVVQFYLNHCKGGSDYVEMMSEEEDEEEEDMGNSIGYQSYRGPQLPHMPMEEKSSKPASLDKMITLVAYLVEKSRGPDNRLRLSNSDIEVVFNGKQFPFLQRQIRDNINLRQTCALICSLCRYNDPAATQIVNMLLTAINRQPETSGPFFRLLSMLVDINSETVGMPLFSTFIYPRIWEIAEHTPQHCLEWLTVQVPRNKVAHSLVLQNMDQWVDYFLLSHNNQRVRNAAAVLLISLVPNNNFRQSYSKSPRMLQVHHQRDSMDLTNEAVNVIHQIFNCLLGLLKRAKIYADPQAHGTTKLVSYFAVMVYCLVNKPEKLLLANHFLDLWNLFQPKLSEPAIAVNHNKQALLSFWYQACIDCPENVRCIVSNPAVVKNIAFNYILADHDDQDVIMFNRLMLPSYYGLLRLCCQQSKSFTRNLAMHQNIQWAFKNITPFANHYQSAAGELFKLMKLFIVVSPETTEAEHREIRQFKRTTLQMYLAAVDPRSAWSTVITALTTLVESDDDRSFVILSNGITALMQSFNSLFIMFHEATACHVTNEIVELLKLLADLLITLRSSNNTEVRDWIPKLKEHGEFIRKLIHLLNTYTPAQVKNAAMNVLSELVQIYPKDSLPLLAQSLGLGHLAFQDQFASFLAGPYFPRRGQRVLQTKSSLRPQRPMFQMHFHLKMLETAIGVDEDYDKAIVEYFYSYYQFIAGICRTAVQHNLVNQEIVGLCSMVALESLPMRLQIFPQLWQDLSSSKDETAKDFISMLCDNCTNFRDYALQILSHERGYLADEMVYKLMNDLLPKIRSLSMPEELITNLASVVKESLNRNEKPKTARDKKQILGDVRTLLLVTKVDKLCLLMMTDLKDSLMKLKETMEADDGGSPRETPQKKRKTNEFPKEDEEISAHDVSGSSNSNSSSNSDILSRLESSISELVQQLDSNKSSSVE